MNEIQKKIIEEEAQGIRSEIKGIKSLLDRSRIVDLYNIGRIEELKNKLKKLEEQ